MFFINFLKRLFKNKNTKLKDESVSITVKKETSKDRFNKAMHFVQVVEGGFFNHPNDPGGFTNMGLTQRDYPNLDLKNLTREHANNIFYRDYWLKSSADKLPYPAFISYFDCVVNTGLSRANKILQESIKTKQDGVVGPITLSLIKDINPNDLAIKIADNRQKFYERIAGRNKKFNSFLKGWTRRTKAIKEYIKTGAFSW